MGKIYLKAPGHFCFVEEINRSRTPEQERERLTALVTMAINKYFNHNNYNSTYDRNEYTYSEKK